MTGVVSDSGPLTHLWQIDAWFAFGTFESIHIATQVAGEVARHVPVGRLEALSGSPVHVEDVTNQELELAAKALVDASGLQAADLATLALAQRIRPELVLTDDLALRRAIEALNHPPMGSVGVLARAYKAGLLNTQSLEQAIDGLFVHSTLYLSPKFRTFVRRLIAGTVQGSDR